MIQVNIQGMGNEKFKIDIGENESELKTISRKRWSRLIKMF